MYNTVGEHIDRLNQKIDRLNLEMMDDRRTEDERRRLQAEVGIAFLALAHFEVALRQEHKLS
jgi:hypothetical protein